MCACAVVVFCVPRLRACSVLCIVAQLPRGSALRLCVWCSVSHAQSYSCPASICARRLRVDPLLPARTHTRQPGNPHQHWRQSPLNNRIPSCRQDPGWLWAAGDSWQDQALAFHCAPLQTNSLLRPFVRRPRSGKHVRELKIQRERVPDKTGVGIYLLGSKT